MSSTAVIVTLNGAFAAAVAGASTLSLVAVASMNSNRVLTVLPDPYWAKNCTLFLRRPVTVTVQVSEVSEYCAVVGLTIQPWQLLERLNVRVPELSDW